jgi:hypothetical protein
MNFLNNVVPAGFYVIARGNIPSSIPNPPQFANTWQNDTTFFGSGNSLYHVLKNQGFAILDSFNRPRTFIFGFKKNDPVTFRPQYTMTQTIFDVVTLNMDVKTAGISGSVTSPLFGRAKAWKRIRSTGTIAPDAPGADSSRLDLIGVNDLGQETLLLSGLSPTQLDQDISGISASQYPFVKLRLFARDTVNLTPYQLRYWQVTYDPVPEGAIAPNLHLSVKDTVDIGEPVNYSFGFKNISETTFDSLQVKLVITDRNNVPIVIPIPRRRPLPAGDTLRLGTLIRTENLPGRNTVFLEANPSPGQPEQFHFNNFAYRNLYVRPDTIQPVMDVTFDGMHILNRDIVSSKPEILVKLKDEARWMILDDTSLLTLQVRHPDGNLRRYYFNNDTLRFIPAGQAPNTDNTASLQFRPRFLKDGEYELVITGKDKSANTAGNLEYKVIFQVVNTPMISNLLNYPNPFTTSTAFVFTLTGSEIPQQLKIEILTVTGRVVREITRDELGPLRIGRNLTEFKWDGTDQYGQKLANGVYLYRVVTNLNGKSLEKYRPQGDNTDAFFNKGYGKMYLMR